MIDTIKRRAAFFDRDGTIIKNVHYLSSIDQIEIIERTIDICRLCQAKGYQLILVTNQSGVARGFFDEAFVIEANRHLFALLASRRVFFTKAYYCPHYPGGIVEPYACPCTCRKPESGMLFAAAAEYEIDLKASIMIGDSEVDIKSGNAAGCQSFDICALSCLRDDELELFL